MSSIASIAVSGMSAAQFGLQASAHNIANLNSADFRRQQVVQSTQALGGVRVSIAPAPQPGHAPEADLVAQLQAKNAFLANLAMFRANDRMTGSLLDVVG